MSFLVRQQARYKTRIQIIQGMADWLGPVTTKSKPLRYLRVACLMRQWSDYFGP